jgi:dTDP-4-amino-4,6-dideoxygalactose transaminase
MNDISASIGLENLKYAGDLVNKHWNNAKYFSENIKNPKVKIQPFDTKSSHWIYTVLVDDKPGFIKYMTEKNIEVSPVHNRNDNYTIFAKFKTELPNLDKFFNAQLAIPVGWWLSQEDLEVIVKAINEWK